MKKIITVIVLSIIALNCFCMSIPDLSFSIDGAFVQDFLFGEGSVQVTTDFGAQFSDEFQLRVPLSVTIFNNSYLEEVGLNLVYYPWNKGPFMGLTLFHVGFAQGTMELPNMIGLNEIILGWTLLLPYGFFVAPTMVIRDPSGTFGSEYSSIKGAFPCYSTYRFRLSCGYTFKGGI